MKRIGLISDTHSYLHPDVALHLQNCDEIWHAGDFGQLSWVVDLKEKLKELNQYPVIRGVYGNIDGKDIRCEFPERLIFVCEDVKVMMQHIGGYPGKYVPGVKTFIKENNIRLFISGHSHILKIKYDESLNCLHMNPGAAGQQGWHKVKTLIRFVIDGSDIKNCEVVELG